MTYKIRFAAPARRALKKLSRSGRFNVQEFYRVVGTLQAGQPLDPRYQDHQLHGDVQEYRELHLEFDLLLMYKFNEALGLLIVANIGTHDELFG